MNEIIIENKVSVSFRSYILSYLNTKRSVKAPLFNLFPSPFGVIFSLIVAPRLARELGVSMFPSPFGVIFSLINLY